jgi:hypothetical protein
VPKDNAEGEGLRTVDSKGMTHIIDENGRHINDLVTEIAVWEQNHEGRIRNHQVWKTNIPYKKGSIEVNSSPVENYGVKMNY